MEEVRSTHQQKQAKYGGRQRWGKDVSPGHGELFEKFSVDSSW